MANDQLPGKPLIEIGELVIDETWTHGQRHRKAVLHAFKTIDAVFGITPQANQADRGAVNLTLALTNAEIHMNIDPDATLAYLARRNPHLPHDQPHRLMSDIRMALRTENTNDLTGWIYLAKSTVEALPKTITLQALQSFRYEGRIYQPGQTLTLTDASQAKLDQLLNRGVVRITTP